MFDIEEALLTGQNGGMPRINETIRTITGFTAGEVLAEIILYEDGWPLEVIGIGRPVCECCLYFERLKEIWPHLDEPARRLIAELAHALCSL